MQASMQAKKSAKILIPAKLAQEEEKEIKGVLRANRKSRVKCGKKIQEEEKARHDHHETSNEFVSGFDRRNYERKSHYPGEHSSLLPNLAWKRLINKPK